MRLYMRRAALLLALLLGLELLAVVAPTVAAMRVQRRSKAMRDAKRTIPIMTEFGEVFYYVSLHIGNPPQHILVTLDTGSALIGLPDANCRACTQMERYNLSISESFEPLRCKTDQSCFSNTCGLTPARCHCNLKNQACTTTTRYSDGSNWNASIVIDDVKLGNFWARVSIGAIFSASSNMFRAPSEGIIGMSRASEWLNALFTQQGQKVPKMWSLCMGSEGGQMSIGSLDANLYSGPISWTPFIPTAQPFYYSVALINFRIFPVDNEKLSQIVTVPKQWVTSGNVLVDTGASHIFVGEAVLNDLRDAIKVLCSMGYSWRGFCVFDSQFDDSFFDSARYDNLTLAELASFPIFELQFADNVTVRLTWEEYLIKREYANGLQTFFLGFLPAVSDEINLGDPFIRSSFIAFDFDRGAMGIAAKTSACD